MPDARRGRRGRPRSSASALRLVLLAAVVTFVAVGTILVGARQPGDVTVLAEPVPTQVATPTVDPDVAAAPAPVAGPEATPPQEAPPASPPPLATPLPLPDPTVDPQPEVEPTPALVPPARYEAHPAEEEPQLKEAASHLVQDLLTYAPGATPRSVADAVGADHGLDPADLEPLLQEVVHPDAGSVAAIIYPQLGGLRATTASVMVAVAQSVAQPDGSVLEESRTMDVWMRRDASGSSWRVDALMSDGGPRTERPADLGELEAAVVDHPRIALPDSGRWDIYRGLISPLLLARMLEIADRHTYGVNVLQTGHPYNVFGTDRVSHHSTGRAVDVYEVDGVLVIDDRHEGSATHTLARWLYETGTPNLGGPWAFDGQGGRSFSDPLHQDHLHINVPAG